MSGNVTASKNSMERSQAIAGQQENSTASLSTQIEGCVDAIEGDRLYGWAWKPSQPDEKVHLSLYVDGQKVADFAADRERADLQANGVGDGRHAFEYRSADGKGLLGRYVEVRIAGDNARLPLQAQAASAVTTLALVNRIAQLEAAIAGLAERDQEKKQVLADLKQQVSAVQRNIKQHDLAIFRQDTALKSREHLAEKVSVNYRRRIRKIYFSIMCVSVFVFGFFIFYSLLNFGILDFHVRENLPEWVSRWF